MSSSADHHATLCSVLARLRRRQRVLGCVRGAARGLLAGAIVIVSLYYYLGVIRRVLVFPATDETPIPVPGYLKAAIVVALVGTIILGIIQGPFFTQADRAAWSLF